MIFCRPCFYCSDIFPSLDRKWRCLATPFQQEDFGIEYSEIIFGTTFPFQLNGYAGCEKFTPSGLPAHPEIIEELVKSNPLCNSVPFGRKDDFIYADRKSFVKEVIEKNAIQFRS